MVPGFTGSGPGHWQAIWERQHPTYRRVEQSDWDHPEPLAWVDTLDRTVRATKDRVVLAGHSLGCMTIVRWVAERGPANAVAALLVAPSDVEAASAPPEVRRFAPTPLQRLPFPAVVVASTNDELVTLARARYFAERWGASLVDIGTAGHIHTAAGYGPWPEGKVILHTLIGD